jgi:hypothetical protein
LVTEIYKVLSARAGCRYFIDFYDNLLPGFTSLLYDFDALKAACSLASSSCESEVFKILPPVPFSSSSTLSLYGVALLSRTNRVELPGLSVADNSFMK